MLEMCRALADRGAEPLLATTDADGPGRLDVAAGTVVSWDGVDTIFFRRQWSEAFKYSRPLSQWLGAHVREFAVVHVHAVLSHASLAAAAACRRAGVPYVIRPLGTLDPWSLRQKRVRKRVMIAVAAAGLLREAAAIHYTSDEEKRGVERALHLSRGVVIPLGVDPGFLSDPVTDSSRRAADPYVLVLSRLHPVKNLEAFIQAFARASSVAPAWRLIVAGSGDAAYTETLRGAVAASGAADRIRFTGWVGGAAKRDLMRRASLFALPSHHENFGVSLVEALAAGVPALVSRSVHLADAVEQAAAGWVAGTDVESMQISLSRAIEDRDDREARGRAAREFAGRFAWPIVAADLMQLYQRVAAHPVPATVSAVGARA